MPRNRLASERLRDIQIEIRLPGGIRIYIKVKSKTIDIAKSPAGRRPDHKRDFFGRVWRALRAIGPFLWEIVKMLLKRYVPDWHPVR